MFGVTAISLSATSRAISQDPLSRLVPLVSCFHAFNSHDSLFYVLATCVFNPIYFQVKMAHNKTYEHTYKDLPHGGNAEPGKEEKPTEAQTGLPYDELGGKYGKHSPERKVVEKPNEGMQWCCSCFKVRFKHHFQVKVITSISICQHL